MKIVTISDTHCQLNRLKLPKGDLLLHAGDATYLGTIGELANFNEQLGRIKHNYKHGIIFTPGNHDWLFERDESLARQIITNAIVLIHESIVVEGLTIFGSPYSPEFMSWAFANKSPGQAENRWKDIPNDTDIVVVHGPPHGFGDKLINGNSVGCKELFKRVMQVKPTLVVSGHIHCGYGERRFEGVTFINAAMVDEMYSPTHECLTFDWPGED